VIERRLASAIAYSTLYRAIHMFSDQPVNDRVQWHNPQIADVMQETGRRLNVGLRPRRRS